MLDCDCVGALLGVTLDVVAWDREGVSVKLVVPVELGVEERVELKLREAACVCVCDSVVVADGVAEEDGETRIAVA